MTPAANLALSKLRDAMLTRLGFCSDGKLSKIEKFSLSGHPKLVVEWPLKTQQNLWIKASDATAPMCARIENERRQFGQTKTGKIALLGRPGRHSGPTGYLESDDLICFHPATKVDLDLMLEGLVT